MMLTDAAQIALGDVAQLAAYVLTSVGPHGLADEVRGQMMVATGPMMTAGPEIASAASSALGSEMEFESVPESKAKQILKSAQGEEVDEGPLSPLPPLSVAMVLTCVVQPRKSTSSSTTLLSARARRTMWPTRPSSPSLATADRRCLNSSRFTLCVAQLPDPVVLSLLITHLNLRTGGIQAHKATQGGRLCWHEVEGPGSAQNQKSPR
jgi:hypothetical protein